MKSRHALLLYLIVGVAGGLVGKRASDDRCVPGLGLLPRRWYGFSI